MMTLDLTTLYIVSGLTITAVSAMFLVEVVRRGATPVDRIWSLALGSALATAVSYAGATTVAELWWLAGLGNGASALTTFALWSGTRGYDGKRPLLGLSAAVAALCALVTIVQGSAAGEWAGGGLMIAATGLGAFLAALAGVRGRLWHVPSGPVLTVILTVVWVYYAVRLVLYVTQGPESAAFNTYTGTELTTLLLTLLVLVAAIVMIAARGEHLREQWRERQTFDPMTGARTPAAFRQRATELLGRARSSGQPVALVAVVVQDVTELVTAFGHEYADQAVLTVGERCVEEAPYRSAVGRADLDAASFDVLLSGVFGSEAAAWADTVRKRVIDSPLEVAGGSVRLRVSIGVTTSVTGEATLAELCADASDQARAALASGGNTVVISKVDIEDIPSHQRRSSGPA